MAFYNFGSAAVVRALVREVGLRFTISRNIF